MDSFQPRSPGDHGEVISPTPRPPRLRGENNTTHLDKTYLWHPFTPMSAWCAEDHDPLVLVSGDGALLTDDQGRTFIDGNSSIWTNIHGHNHPRINAALREQLDRVAHTSFLGFTNPPAARLAERLVKLFPADTLTRVFYTDDGSTAIEVALKMAAQFRQLTGQPERTEFVAFDHAYHGDTMGASSLGGIPLFHDRFAAWQFPVKHVPDLDALRRFDPARINAVIIEPLIQGAAGMRLWPAGMLRELRAWCDAHDVFLILDEVMTGFGRTGKMFACEHEAVTPDFLCLAKGLTGGYLPLAATLTTTRVFEAFLGGPERTLFYGHSYCGNQLGCAAALASLDIFEEENVLAGLPARVARFTHALDPLRKHPRVKEVRQCGLIAGIEIHNNTAASLGVGICLRARAHGLLTRPIRDTLVLMPPLCTTDDQMAQAVTALLRVL